MGTDELQVEDLLRELRQEGQLESSGVFSLDISRAREKLGRFQLEDPFRYALKLVQAAVAAQADAFEWRSGSSAVSAQIQGVVFPAERLRHLVYYLLQSEALEPGLRHLAVAVNAAVGTRASEISIRCWDGSQGWAAHWTSQGCRLEEWVPPSQERGSRYTRFEMQRALGDRVQDLVQKVTRRSLFGMWRGDRQQMDREQALIYDWCSFAPIPIVINGQSSPGYSLGQPYRRPGRGLWGWLGGGRSNSVDSAYHLFEIYHPSRHELGLAPPRRSYSRYRRGYDMRETFDHITVLQHGFARSARLVPILDGVLLPVLELDWSGPGGIFYVSARQLDLDLTGLAVRHSQRTLRVAQALARELLDACEDFLKKEKLPRLKDALRVGRSQEVRLKSGVG